MTEQEKREKVIKGLECCMLSYKDGCDECPYIGKGMCQELLGEHAIALLKAQEPRVMTLEEVKSLERDAVVWYEHKGKNKPRQRVVDEIVYCDIDEYLLFTDGGKWYFKSDNYGSRWRCWTSRPDQATREAVKWE